MRGMDLNQCLVSRSHGELGRERRRILSLVCSQQTVSEKNSNSCLLWKTKAVVCVVNLWSDAVL